LWLPTAQPAAQIGALPLILGTIWVSLGAILLALPLGIAAAIYMATITHRACAITLISSLWSTSERERH